MELIIAAKQNKQTPPHNSIYASQPNPEISFYTYPASYKSCNLDT